jgi:hypothetical protein
MDDETRRALTSALVDVASRRCQGRPAWRGAQAAVARPYPAVTCHVGVNGGRAPSPLCVTAPRKKVGASTYSSSGPTMKRCLTSHEVSRWKSR